MSNASNIELTDALAAGVFRAGLKAGVLNPGPIIAWADGRIVELAEPASWLIDLSIASPDQVNDIVMLLRPASEGVSAETIANAGLALLDLPAEKSPASARRLLSIIYPFVQHAQSPALRQLDEMGSAFDGDPEKTAADVFAFAADRQNAAVRAFLAPVMFEV